ncbi:Ferric hydroxamate ABC transporter (TC 3.A.1.14.3), ATP-binding protein FhuC [Citrobacter freundii]|uniref:Ferric hydroxamate ABC transporter (TC 3.A.1.14.3), ATP-binding protein FhuC n=1 Tax=Citrobacter freundii TaxID=546 RepID=A0A7G2IJD9_CITFR|nr:Ferric hydroxamate ABC transporter (TC 3.A.1.14.3), ATP-binding protein FhuC [Citrobacter freundii]
MGKVTGLIGHNGSGKSTLLKMLGRHQPPSEGEILLDEQPLENWSSKAFARKVAYLPQQLPQAEGMTVRELVAIGRYPWHGALGRFWRCRQRESRRGDFAGWLKTAGAPFG